jgi:hypothetical protein
MCFEKDPLLLCLTETHVTENIMEREISIENYNIARCNSNSRHTGGVIIYIRKDIKYKVIENKCISKTWFVTITSDDNLSNVMLCLIYKSPKEKINTFLSIIDEIMEYMCVPGKRVVIIGDMNINIARKCKNAKKYLTVINNHNLYQLINAPTRVTDKSKSIIDHIISNDKYLFTEIIKESPTDHYMLLINMLANRKLKKVSKIVINSFKNYSKDRAIKLIDEMKWNITNNAEIDASQLIDNVLVMVNKQVCKITVINNPKLIFDSSLRQIKNDLKMAREKLYITNDTNDELKLKEVMMIYKSALINAKSHKLKNDLLKNKNDSRKLWSILNRMYKNDIQSINELIIDNESITDKKLISEKLNHFFVESIESIVCEIENSSKFDYNDKIARCNGEMSFYPVKYPEIKSILRELKSKSYRDHVKGSVLVDLIDSRVFMMCFVAMINNCLKQSIMPSRLKQSTVTPVPKERMAKTPALMRPINNMPVLEKAIEAVVINRLMEHLKNNKILSINQFGFRKNHSTESAIQCYLYEIFMALENNEVIITVALDFRRAFETIDRDLLCEKLELYGIKGREREWFRNYLSNRSQVTNVDGNISEPLNVLHGLPQGSKLSNILFLLFINDISLHTKSSKMIMFADDALITIRSNKIENAAKLMNEDLAEVNDWLKFNKMAINTNKCNAMIINDKSGSTVKFFMNSMEIELVNQMKYLGVWIDNKFDFQCHFNKLLAKLNQKVALLRRLSRDMDNNSKKLFFNAIILPIVDYCPTVLQLMDGRMIRSIQTAVNKAMRVVLNADKYAGTDELCERLDMPPIKMRIEVAAMKYVNKIVTKGEPLSIREKFTFQFENRKKTLRNDGKFCLPKWKNEKARKSIYYKSIDHLNNMKIDNAKSFESNCINFFKS